VSGSGAEPAGAPAGWPATEPAGLDGAPALIAVAHGSRDPDAARTIEAILRRVRGLRPGLAARAAYLDIVPPAVATALTAAAGPVVAVPMLLATGYHAAVDVPTAVAAARPDASVGRVLGPHPLLADALADRLRQAGWRPSDAIILAAAGSADPAAAVATETQARLLAERLGDLTAPHSADPGPARGSGASRHGSGGVGGRPAVTVGYASARPPSVPAAVAAARAAGAARVVVASYLLAPGVFQAGLAGAGADLVTEPLGDHPAVVRLVLLRYDEARSAG
jgi:sirohydrochlorin ferrochelatase